ncbi:hypothetical protein DH2020_002876 [Rehmannia glutinosa]|uniref:SWIM-type domain-containing protein n=1 Tax=Rehmannia glutinosa TaxID=99300 RepID=A0ABR0XVE2_REHGL
MVFDYDVDQDEQLTRLFWANQTAIMNYAAFGDVISFDVTYNTNRYKMVFAPFTGVDNHRMCVTFAAGLILKEDEESYTWLFRRFLDVVAKEPYYIVTDQDPAMKNAIKSVFKTAKHRLFMYDIRQSCIPAYFRDVPMSGLLKTTLLSESTNSWFGNFTNPQSNLVEFVMHFESAMESQRHSSDKLNNQCQTSLPDCQTPLKIEKHAFLVYTHAIFYEVSKEIKEACYHCSVIQINDNTNEISYTIKEESGVFQVTKCKIDASAKCSCKLFEQMRLLCRHIFVIFKDCDEIPAPYLEARWMKATSFNSHSKNGHMYQFPGGIEAARTLNTLWADFHSCIGLAQGDIEKLSSLSRIISNEKAKLLEEQHKTIVPSKQSVMETYCGSTSQLHISVLPPKQAKNKGSGSHLKSRLQAKEKNP